jgi:arylsulfatase A-like enzyme
VSDKPHFFANLPEPTRRERRAMKELTRQRAESIYVMDQQVGHLIGRLKQSGEWDETVFLFTSDNGYFLGEHRQRQGKARAHEPSLRVPLVLTGPGLRGGTIRDDPVTTVDLTATVLALAGAEPPRPADGTSRAPTLRRGDRGWTVPVLNESIHGLGADRQSAGFDDRRVSIGVRTARYSYIRNRVGRDELYDLWADPTQDVNVIDHDDYRERRRMLSDVWWDVRNCSRDRCRAVLPAELQAPPARLSDLTDRYWSVIRRAYGFG